MTAHTLFSSVAVSGARTPALRGLTPVSFRRVPLHGAA